ncbi:MAG: YheC/YheD family protein [Syntrophomonas sp.]|nr:YheC/YheD family protein [Syntrophomonas sp.]
MHKFRKVIFHKNTRLNRSVLGMGIETAKELGLQNGDKIHLFAGRLFTPLKLIINTSTSNTSKEILEINDEILNKMLLSDGVAYGICRNNTGLHLGPVVGIMIDSSSDIKRPFGDQSFFISQLIDSATAMGQICFAFSTNSVDFSRKKVFGFSFVNGVWKKRVFPIPDVVYPREASFSKAKLLIRRKMQSTGCKFINPPMLGKWESHKILSQDPALSQYIPETRRVTSFNPVVQMLNKYGAVYLKPIDGTKGKNIIRVLKNKKSPLYHYQFQPDSQPRIGTSDEIKLLRAKLGRYMGKRNYIVQRRINLLKVNGNIADIRILAQKDHTGQWLITGAACRIGKKGSITSNISSGGSAKNVRTVVEQSFADPFQSEAILAEIDHVALEAARVLEANTSSMGELGIDIGIDQDGKVWFIEANLRPARRIFNLLNDPVTRLKSVEKPLLYARYLAEFCQERQE